MTGLTKFDIHALYGPFLRHFRRARVHMMYDAVGITGETSILDVGGDPGFWRIAEGEGLPLPRLVILNLRAPCGGLT